MAKIKICGITNVEDATWAANLGADYLGLVFAKESKRKVSLDKAREIIEAIPPYLEKVGLFVNEEPKIVDKILSVCKFDLLQFHGQESPEYCLQFRERARIIKAFRLSDQQSLEQIAQYDVDFYLLDAFVDGQSGGTGQVFNWDLALQAQGLERSIFLAGGLNPDNVVEAIKKVGPFAVDVSSGIESSPRKKSVELMQQFIRRANSVK